MMVWRGINLEGRTDLHVLNQDTLRAVMHRDANIRPIARPYSGAVGPRFLLVQDRVTFRVSRVYRQLLEEEGINAVH